MYYQNSSLFSACTKPQTLYVWRKFMRRRMNCGIVIEEVKHKIKILVLFVPPNRK